MIEDFVGHPPASGLIDAGTLDIDEQEFSSIYHLHIPNREVRIQYLREYLKGSIFNKLSETETTDLYNKFFIHQNFCFGRRGEFRNSTEADLFNVPVLNLYTFGSILQNDYGVCLVSRSWDGDCGE
jgi:hypothetical protein